MAREHRHIGKPAPRLAARELVTGKAKFTGDIRDTNWRRGFCGRVLKGFNG